MPDHESTSWTMISGAAAAQAEPREAFGRRYEPAVRAYFAARWRLPYDHEDVIDAAQDVFVECFRDGGVLQCADRSYPGGFRAYLYGVARNVGLRTEAANGRQRQRRGRATTQLDELACTDATLSQVYDRAWALMVTRDAGLRMIRRVSRKNDGPLRARVLERRHARGMVPRAIARELGVDIRRVYELLRHSRTEFRDALFDVMRSYHPRDSQAEIEQRSAEVLLALRR